MQGTKEADQTVEIIPARPHSRGRLLLFGAIVLGLLCAGIAFLVLVAHDRDAARVMVHDQAASTVVNRAASAGRNAPTSTVARPSEHATVPAQVTPARTSFRLERSNKPAELGPIHVRLMRTDPRHASYEIRVISGKRWFAHRHLRSGLPVWITLGRGKGSLEIVATAVEKNAIEGYWVQSEETPEPVSNKGSRR